MSEKLTLISHHLCPYVQRAVISLTEKGVPFVRIYIDLANKPDWFTGISPLGKVPLLKVENEVLFESAVILEYLEETQPHPLHPFEPLERARHRSWIEFGSSILNDIAGFYNAPDEAVFDQKTMILRGKFGRLEEILDNGPWFAGDQFSLVDAVYGPVFRYFDTFSQIDDFAIFNGLERVSEWRRHLAVRPSVANAVSPDYPDRLMDFLRRRGSYLSAIIPLAQAAE